jgi:hypothetical protein
MRNPVGVDHSGHFEINSLHGDPVPPEQQSVQSNSSYAAYGAENDPEQTTNAFATAELSDSKLSSYFSGFGPMSPSQGKDFFNKPTDSSGLFDQPEDQSVQPLILASELTVRQGLTDRETGGMVRNFSQNHDQQQFDPMGSSHMVDGIPWPNSIPHLDTKKQDVEDNKTTQFNDNEIIGRDKMSLVPPGSSTLCVVAQSSVSSETETANSEQQNSEEKAMGLNSSQLDQLSDQFATHSISNDPSFLQQLSKNDTDVQKEPILATRLVNTGVFPNSSTNLTFMTEVQPNNTSLPSETVSSHSQLTTPSGSIPHSTPLSEQLVTDPHLAYFPSISPPGEQVDAASDWESKPSHEQSAQSQTPSGIEGTQTSVAQRPSVTSDNDLPTSTIEQRHSMSLPFSEDGLPSHASQSHASHSAGQELSVFPPQALLNSSEFPPTSHAWVNTTNPIGTNEVNVIASSQSVVSPVLQAEGHYQYQSITGVTLPSAESVVFPTEPSARDEQPRVSHLLTSTSSNETTAIIPFQQSATNTTHSLFSETLTNKGETDANQALNLAEVVHPPGLTTGQFPLAAPQQTLSSHLAAEPSVAKQTIMLRSSKEQQSHQVPIVTTSDIHCQPTSMTLHVSSSSSATQLPVTRQFASSGSFPLQPSITSQHQTQLGSVHVSSVPHFQPLHPAVSEDNDNLNQQNLQSEPPTPTRAPLQTHSNTSIISSASAINPSQRSLQFTLSNTGAIPPLQPSHSETLRPGADPQDTMYSGHEARPLLACVPQTSAIQQDVQPHPFTTHQNEWSQPPMPPVRGFYTGYDQHSETNPNMGHSFLGNRSHPSAFHEPERLPLHVPPRWPQGYAQYPDQYQAGRAIRRHYGGYRGYRTELYDDYPDNYYEHDYYYMQKQHDRYNPYSTDKHYRSYPYRADGESRWNDHLSYIGHYGYPSGSQHEYGSQYYGAHEQYYGDYDKKSTVETDYQPDLSSIHGGDDKFGVEGMGVDYQDTSQFVAYDGHEEYDQSQHYKGSFFYPGVSEFYSDNASWRPIQKTPSPPPRETPVKFNRPHVIARFSVRGHLVTVVPQLLSSDKPCPVEISEVNPKASQDITEIASFPGPLLRDETPKTEVVAFASHKASLCRKSAEGADNPLDKESLLSSALLWDYLILLCRQNGAVDGNDVSDLLMRQSELPPGQQQPQPCDMYAAEIQYRNLLLSGRKKQALETAVRGQLWGQAFALACRMDSRVQNSVMTRFVESHRSSDPLQTYYLMLSGKQPLAVRGTMDPSWGDWKPHVAMIMANKSSDDDLSNIMAVSANLAKRDMFGSHLCYLLAGGRISHPSESRCKAALLGADHTLPLKEYATTEAIQRTEVYEYACSLNDINFCCPALQYFKLLYAYSLIDCGLSTRALQYCEAISQVVHFVPGKFSSSFVSQLYELGCRLHSCDTHSRTMYHDGLPEWLLSLEVILSQREDHIIKTAEPTPSPLPPAVIANEGAAPMEGYLPADNLNYQDIPQSTQSGMYMWDPQIGASLQPPLDHQLFNGSSRSSLAGSRTDLLSAGREHEQPYQFQGYDNGGNVAPLQIPLSTVGSHQMNAANVQSGVVGYMPAHSSWDGVPHGDSGPPPQPPSLPGMNYTLETNAQSNIQSDTGMERESNPEPWEQEQTSAQPTEENDEVSDDNTSKKKVKESKPTRESSWFNFGGWWKRIKPNSNQMNLPDDKKKSIVWDGKLKKWVNSEENEEETSGPAAPPTDFQLKSQGVNSALGQQDSISGNDHMVTSLPGTEPDGPTVNKPPVNAYSRIASGPRGRLSARAKYVDVLNPAGSRNSSTQSSVVPTPAVPGFTNPMPNQQYSGTFFVPELSGTDTGSTFTPQQDQVQSSEGQIPFSQSSGSQMPLMFNTSTSNGYEQTRLPTPDRMSTASEVSEFSMEVRQHMGYMGSTEQSSDQTVGQIPMYSSSGPPPTSGLHSQPQRGLGRLKGARPQFGGAGMPSKLPTAT